MLVSDTGTSRKNTTHPLLKVADEPHGVGGATVLRELTPIDIVPETIGTAAEAVAEQVTAVSDEETLSELEDGRIVQPKTHKVAPMTVEEA